MSGHTHTHTHVERYKQAQCLESARGYTAAATTVVASLNNRVVRDRWRQGDRRHSDACLAVG